MIYACLFMLGASFASFINVVSLRQPLGKDYIKGRSCCPKCQHQLSFMDMFPIFGWVILKGKCRYCGNRISIRYFLIEIIGGCLILICFFKYALHLRFYLSISFFMVLLLIALIDYQTMMIPDTFIVILLFIDLFFLMIEQTCLEEHLIGFFVVSLPLYFFNCCYKESFGGGDIKLFAVGGLFLGWKKILLAAMISIVTAGFYALYLMIFKKIHRNDYMAFGPFIAVGIVIAMLYGDRIIYSYMNYIHM